MVFDRPHMTSLQTQARALGDPTRHAIFQYLVEHSRAVDVAELTAHLGLHHNAIRQHLAKLLDAELIVESTVPNGGPGRPKLVYRVDPSTDSRWGPNGPYERLSWLLTELATSDTTPVEIGRRATAGDPIDPETSAVGALTAHLTSTGFDPTVEVDDSTVRFVLGPCPFASTAALAPKVVCELHRGMAMGIAERAGSITVEDLAVVDPHQGGCVLTCRLS